MLFTDAKFRYTREQAARAVSLPQTVIDILVQQGRLSDPISPRALEELFRDTLLRLYHAEATRAARVASPAPERVAENDHPLREPKTPEPVADEHPVITRTIGEYQASRRVERPNLRIATRYTPRRAIQGNFRDMEFTLLQISATGLRIRHEDTVRPGDEARVTLSLTRPPRAFALRARIAWTSISQRGEGASFCLSGLRATANNDALLEAIEVLRQSREIQVDGEGGGSRRGTPAALAGLSDEDVAQVIGAYHKFSSNPVEAAKWYAQGRVAANNAAVRKRAPERPRDREEVLAIWEFLERNVEIGTIANVINWLRQTRSSAAV